MSGPGQYLPDPTAGMTNPRDLPQAKIVRRSRNFKHLPRSAARHAFAIGPVLACCTTWAIW